MALRSQYFLPQAPKSSWSIGDILWGLALLVALRPFSLQLGQADPRVLGAAASRPYETYLVTAVAALCILASTKALHEIGRILRANPLLPLFMGLGALSAAWSNVPYLTLRTTGDAIAIVAIVIAAASAGPKPFQRRVIFALFMVLILSVASVVLMPRYGLQISDSEGSGIRWRGIYSAKNHLGIVAAQAFLLIFIVSPPLINRYIAISGALLALLCVLMARSSTGIVLILTSLSFYIVFFKLTKWPRLLVGFLCALTLPILYTYGVDFIVFGTGLLGRDASFTGRTELWVTGLKLAMEHPIGGEGLSAFSDPYIRAVFAAASIAAGHLAVYDPHNAFILLAITLGTSGVALMIAMIALASIRLLDRTTAQIDEGARRMGAILLVSWTCSAFVESSPFWLGTPEFSLGLLGIIAACVMNRSPGVHSQMAPDKQPRRRRPTAIRPTGRVRAEVDSQ